MSRGSSKGTPCSSGPPKARPGVIDGAPNRSRRSSTASATRRRDRRPPNRIDERSGDQPQRDRGAARHRSRKRISRRRAASRRRGAGADAPATTSEWASVGSGGREDGDYNLEAFVSAEPTLADHLAEQLVAGDRRSGPADDRAIPDRHGRRGRLPHRRSRVGGREARRAAGRSRGGARHRAGLRSAGRVRAQSHRMPGDPAQGAQPLRSGDGRRWSAASICWPSATSPACGASAASATRTSPT